MKLFEQYITRKFVPLVTILTLGTLILLGLVDYIANVNRFLYISFTQIIYFYILKNVPFLSFVLPIAVFLAASITTKRLTKSNEIIAYLSLGGWISSLMKPFIVHAIFICKIVLILEFFLIPMANKTKREFEEEHNLKHPLGKENESSIYLKISDTKFLVVGYYDLEKNIGKNITIDEVEKNTLKSRIQAEKIEWNEEDEEGFWTLKNWKKTTYGKNNNITSQGLNMVLDDITLDPSVLWINLNLKNKITMPVLTEYIKMMEEQGIAYAENFKIEQARRIKSIFLIIILMLLGVFAFIRINNRRGNENKLIKLIIIAFILKSSFIPSNTVYFLNLNAYTLMSVTIIIDFLLLFYLYKKIKR